MTLWKGKKLPGSYQNQIFSSKAAPFRRPNGAVRALGWSESQRIYARALRSTGLHGFIL
jgi:hypothetical protein